MRLRLQQGKVDFQLRIVIVSEVQEGMQRNGGEMEKNRNKSSNFNSYVTCFDVVVSYKLFWN